MPKKRFILVLTALLELSVITLSACEPQPGTPSPYTALAKCLTSKGVIFYGAYWCSHCQAQKKMFGNAMQYIHYVECAANDPAGLGQPEQCTKAKINAFPTWFFPGQEPIVGEVTIEELAQKANCEDSLKPENTQQPLQSTEQTVQSAPPSPQNEEQAKQGYGTITLDTTPPATQQ
jgi:thiol-disulfide isomerase/thioredoxin